MLIAVDGSDWSTKAAKVAHRLFGDDADYVIVSVADTPIVLWGDSMQFGVGYSVMISPFGGPVPIPNGGRGNDGTNPSALDVAQGIAQTAADEADLPNAEVLGDVGDAARAILAEARRHRADVIVVGDHHRGWFSRLFDPSVAGAVVEEGEISVLIAR